MMKTYILIILILLTCFSCQQKTDILYHSDSFSIYSDKVVQGIFESKAISSDHIISNYQSATNDHFSRLISFKFSINEKDNENAPGLDHRLIVEDDMHTSPTILFGQSPLVPIRFSKTSLPKDHNFMFKLDMREVFMQFENKGYYTAFDGSTIAKDDFKGVFIAGGSLPLSWDFHNLKENNLELTDEDHDHIYEFEVVFNPSDDGRETDNEWRLSKNIKAKPSYKSNQPIVDALYKLSLEEALLNIEPDSTLRTGAKWDGVWTRDVSYSTLLAFAYIEPEIAKISLKKKVKNGVIIQDTGSGGAWPISSDRTTWVLAAWEIYKVTGEQEWLEYAYQVVKNTLEIDAKTLKSQETNMYKGESSFLDWREQTYPRWMTNSDIYISKNLGTNVVHFQAHIILSKMADILGKPNKEYLQTAIDIKDGINKYLWLDDKNYYAQYLYGRNHSIISEKSETLGEALAVLFDVSSEEQSRSIIESMPLTTFGATCIYPQIPNIPPYHNQAIWPFVQAYWNLAAAKAGNEKVLNHGLASIFRPTALFLSNYENFVADTGDNIGTEINSHRMLWSMAGTIAMIHRVFMGVEYHIDGISFHPTIPKSYSGIRTLSNYNYREADLTIRIVGHGNEIDGVKLDGVKLDRAFISSDLKGTHLLEIRMKNNRFSEDGINLVENKEAPEVPKVEMKESVLSWNNIENASNYKVYKNGSFVCSTMENTYKVDREAYGEYTVCSIDDFGTESFHCEPLNIYPSSRIHIIEFENLIEPDHSNQLNYSGTGYVKTTIDLNKLIEFPLEVSKVGHYILRIRYSNGTGPWNTDNNCAIRSLYVNDVYEDILVFAQRGQDEWSNWGWSNGKKINLREGENTISIVLEDWNENMDGEINEALLDCIEIIKI